MSSKKYPPLRPAAARSSLASRLSRVADIGRQVEVRLGFRPYQVFLVWTRWNGDERGEGVQEVVHRCQLVPTPVVQDLTGVALSPFGAGILPVGSVRIREVSARYSLELLSGKVIPGKEDQVPHPYDFFYEVVEDGRHECPPLRPRFNLFATPFLDAPNQQWILVLERQSGDMGQDGKPVHAPVVPPVDPWVTRRLDAPEDE